MTARALIILMVSMGTIATAQPQQHDSRQQLKEQKATAHEVWQRLKHSTDRTERAQLKKHLRVLMAQKKLAQQAPVNHQVPRAVAGPAHTATSTQGQSPVLPTTFALEQNYPNPFNPATTIRYQLPVESRVMIRVFDLLGREVHTLVEATQAAGYYQVSFNATALASGVYFYRMEALPVTSVAGGSSAFHQLRKLVVVK
jgi:hypothetical protein